MSRIANKPIKLSADIHVNIDGQTVIVKGKKGEISYQVHALVKVAMEANCLKISPNDSSRQARALAGTTRVLLQNNITGISEGFERKLELIGVGYRAAISGKTLNLSLGFSHPVEYAIPEGISIDVPSQTEVVVKGANKQQVGQVAAKLRSYRPPEPYKGKGMKYIDEHVIRKEAKK